MYSINRWHLRVRDACDSFNTNYAFSNNDFTVYCFIHLEKRLEAIEKKLGDRENKS